MDKIVYGTAMPTKMPMVSFAVDDELMQRLDDFRFGNRINTRSEAIRRLLDEALKKHEKNPPK